MYLLTVFKNCVHIVLIALVVIGVPRVVDAQEQQLTDSALTKLAVTLPNYLESTTTKVQQLESKLAATNQSLLKSWKKAEAKLLRKLGQKDSIAAQQLLQSGQQTTTQLTQRLQRTAAQKGMGSRVKEYIPSLDTLQTSIRFIEQYQQQIGAKLPNIQLPITDAQTKLQALQTQLQQTADIKGYIKHRKQALQAACEQVGILRSMKSLNKQAYYYQEQLKEYKALLNDKQKLEQKALAALGRLPLFQRFMKENSQLASLFRVPDNYGSTASLAGLQTRASVNQLISDRLGVVTAATPSGGVGSNPQTYLQQQVQQAQQQLNQLKNKLNQWGGSSGDDFTASMTKAEGGFQPNRQKTKSFWKRIEVGMNVQSQRTNVLLPVTSDIAFTIGYKLNDKATIGTGLSYKLGWGNGWRDIRLTNEGMGLRSYMDIKLPPLLGKIDGGLWISGGYEQNYLPSLRNKVTALAPDAPMVSNWQQSGLVGLSKKLKIGKKSQQVQVLWDFLSYQQIPRSQPIKFRVGMGL